MTTLIPLNKRIIVEAEKERTTSSGIILTGSSVKEKPKQGTVVAVSDGCTVKVGDQVLFSKYTPDEIEVDGKELLVILEESLLAVINE